MPYTKEIPQWNAAGTKPPQSLIDTGWQFNQKPPADYFNWQWHNVYQVLNELHQFALHTEKLGAANGVATLGSDSKLTASQLPAIGSAQITDGSITNNDLATDVKVGSLALLTTTTKSNVVAAVNEVKSSADTHNADSVRHVTQTDKNTWNAKASTAVATTSANGLMSSADKTKLDGVAANANNYSHPATHPATMIDEDATHRFVTDTEKATWNSKASTAVATTSANGLMSSGDKSKLDGIASGANNYSHPTGDGNLHVPATGTTSNGKFLKAGATAGSASWQTILTGDVSGLQALLDAKADASHGHSLATSSVNGFMSSGDKSKLDGIAAGANNYTHPSSHPPSIIAQDSSNRFVTDAEKSSWNAKETTSGAQAKADAATNAAVAWAQGYGLGTTGKNVNGVDMNTVTESGFYSGYTMTNAARSGISTFIVVKYSPDWIVQQQFFIEAGGTFKVFIRTRYSGTTWGDWKELANTDLATTTVAGLMSNTDKTKLDSVATGANNYSHPSTHPATMITEDSTHRFVTDAEKSSWNAKETTSGAQTKADAALNAAKAYAVNMMANGSTSDPNLTLDGYMLTNHANSPGLGLYWHIDTRFFSSVSTSSNRAQIAHAYNSSLPRTFIRNYYSSYGWSVWKELADTDLATSAIDGLMRKEDKAKLDGIATGANNYSHPSTHPATMITEDSTHRFATDAEKSSWNNAADETTDLKTTKTNKDANGIYTTITYRRKSDNTLFAVSTLSGGTSPSYTTRTVTYYATNGSTVKRTVTYALSYDSDGTLISEV